MADAPDSADRRPAVLWLLWRRPDVWRDVWVLLPPAALGALPWLVSNLANDWWSFDVASGQTPYATRLRGFVSATFPMALGLRIPFTSAWPLGTALSAVVYAGLAVLFVIAWRRRRSAAVGLLFVVVAAFPFLYAISPSTWIVDEPRYVVVLLPVLALLAAQGLTSVPRATLGVGTAVVLSGIVLWHLSSSPEFYRRADGLFVPRDFRPLVAELEQKGPAHVFAGYWIAYRLDFETRERIIAAEATLPSLGVEQGRVVPLTPRKRDENRHPAYDTIVRADKSAGFVLLKGNAAELRARPLLERTGYVRAVIDEFAVDRRQP